MRPPAPLGSRPLSKRQQQQLHSDVIAIARRWPGQYSSGRYRSCGLCGRPLGQRDPIGTPECRRCARMPADHIVAADWLAEFDDCQYLYGRKPTVDEVCTRLYAPMLIADTDAPAQSAEDIAQDDAGGVALSDADYERACHQALSSAMVVLLRHFSLPPAPQPPAEMPRAHLVLWLGAQIGHERNPDTLTDLVAVTRDTFHAHLPWTVADALWTEIAQAANRHRTDGGRIG